MIVTTIQNFLLKKAKKKGKYKFSLRNFIISKLSILDISSTNSIIIDTYKSEHICFSYRKSLNKKEIFLKTMYAYKKINHKNI